MGKEACSVQNTANWMLIRYFSTMQAVSILYCGFLTSCRSTSRSRSETLYRSLCRSSPAISRSALPVSSSSFTEVPRYSEPQNSIESEARVTAAGIADGGTSVSDSWQGCEPPDGAVSLSSLEAQTTRACEVVYFWSETPPGLESSVE